MLCYATMREAARAGRAELLLEGCAIELAQGKVEAPFRRDLDTSLELDAPVDIIDRLPGDVHLPPVAAHVDRRLLDRSEDAVSLPFLCRSGVRNRIRWCSDVLLKWLVLQLYATRLV